MSSLDILASRLPGGTVSTDPQTLRDHAIDSWSLALLRRVRGDDLPEPRAILFPARTEEVATVLAWASQTGTAVIPRGAGSGVCGGAAGADPQAVVLDLSRMDRIGPVDPESQTVDVQAGVRGDRLEDELARSGLTTGHYPQSIAISTVGGWIAASSAGQASTGFGAIEDVLLGLTAVLPDGEILRCARCRARPPARPAKAPHRLGGDARRGHRGDPRLPGPPARPGTGWPSATQTSRPWPTALRDVKRAETGAAVLRGYDETDAQLGFGALGPHDRVRGAGRLPVRPAGPGRQEAGRRQRSCKARGPNSAPATASTGGSTATTRCRPTRRSWGPSARSAPG